jgi:undecaprenyl diphosphate synthase
MSAGQRQGQQPAGPSHVAIIMDGNGRWAQMRGLPRQEGHRRGLEALRRTVKNAGELGIAVLTLYSFSTENWRRPQAEVSFLMGLLKRFVEKDLAELDASGVKVRIIGGREDLAPDLRRLVEHAEAMTCNNTGMTLAIAFNYGSRDEIVRSARALAAEVAAGRIAASAIDEALFSSRLTRAICPIRNW